MSAAGGGDPGTARFDVFYVISSLMVGGTERHLASVASRLAARGHKVAIYCLFEKGSLAGEAEAQGVELFGPPLRIDPNAQGRVTRVVRLALSGLKLFRLMVVRRPGITHLFGPPACLTGGLTACCAGAGRLIASRRSLNNYQTKYPVISRIERRLHRRMSAVLGNSRAVTDQLQNEEGVPPDKLGLIYNGIDLARFASPVDRATVRGAVQTGTGDLVFVIVANLLPYKGHADLLAAFGSIKEKLPENWKLWIAGREDGCGPGLKRQCAELGLEEHVRFLGLRDDVPALLKSADIAVSSSHEEGFSNAILEAMAASLPVVATDVGGNAEAVVDGETGLVVVPARDTGALAGALVQMASDRRAAARMGRAGRARLERHFTLDACTDNYEALYVALMAGLTVGAAAGITTALQMERAGTGPVSD